MMNQEGGSMRLAGRVALVTGCGPNINAGIAYGLADEGAKLACVDWIADYAEGCARAIRGRGGQTVGLVCDVTREDDVQSAVAQAEAALGPIDVLVNGAALQIRKGLLDVSLDEFRRQLDVSLGGALLFTKHVARSMIKHGRRGSIVNIGSTEGHQGNIGNIAYGTAKAGLLHFTRSAAMELAEFGIRVNSLSPTGTDPAEGLERAAAWGVTWEQGLKDHRRADTSFGDQGVPLGRRPSPQHYARGVVFLASDDAEMITGIDLRVDAGTISRYWRWNPGTKILPAD
jgi:NAD(P)-dependent dehydrogenase (short-subunit alcohol dehydrogenase family)